MGDGFLDCAGRGLPSTCMVLVMRACVRESRSKSNVPSPIDGIKAPVLSLKLVGTDILRNWMEWMDGWGRKSRTGDEGSRVHLNKCTVCSSWRRWGFPQEGHRARQGSTPRHGSARHRGAEASGCCRPKRSARVEFSRNLPRSHAQSLVPRSTLSQYDKNILFITIA